MILDQENKIEGWHWKENRHYQLWFDNADFPIVVHLQSVFAWKDECVWLLQEDSTSILFILLLIMENIMLTMDVFCRIFVSLALHFKVLFSILLEH